MRCLAIDCATQACSVALFETGQSVSVMRAADATQTPSENTSSLPIGPSDVWQLLAHDYRDLGRGHAEQLIPMIEALPDKGRADHIVVALGPGSFTGVRIGIAAARALAIAWGAELLGYPTLALVAAQARAENLSQQRGDGKDKSAPLPITVAMIGGHGQWFVQSYTQGGSADSELYSLTPSEAVNKFSNPIIAGSAALEFGSLRSVKHIIAMLPDSKFLPLLQIQHFTRVISPIYGREPDARIAGNG